MAYWYQNFVSAPTFVPSAGDGAGWGLLFGAKWGPGGRGTGASLDFSFPNLGQWANNYGSVSPKEYTSMAGFTALEKAGARLALAEWAKAANLTFTEVAETGNTVGEIRFAYSSHVDDGSAAHAYYPGGNPSAGDAWFSFDEWNTNGGGFAKGSFDFQTILHELGHSLGLKHPFDGPNTLNDPKDNFFYTIMSYTASPWSPDKNNYASFYPTTPMYYDLLAIQALYGKKANNATNTVYSFKDGFKYFQTINDTGGNDTMIYIGVENSTINLNASAFSQVSERIFFTGGSSRGTVAIGPAVLIENATGGSGHDTLTGNGAANKLYGNNGNDTLIGGLLNDFLSGGNGNDKLVGGGHSDTFLFNTPLNSTTNRDTITDYNVAADAIRLENAIFTKLTQTGGLPAIWFKKAAGALDVNDYIIYQPGTGYLIYDFNGNGAGGATIFAKLPTGLAMVNTEFVVI